MKKAVRVLSICAGVTGLAIGLVACGSDKSSTDNKMMSTTTTVDSMMHSSTTAPDAMMHDTTTAPGSMSK
jgi:hypothetical protein